MKDTQFQPAPMLYVRNNGDEAFVDKYNGEDFEIPPGGYLPMPVEAARLCLGYTETEKGRVLARLGWAPTPQQFKAAIAKLNKFSFHGTEEEAARGPKGQSHAPLGSNASSDPSGEDDGAGSSGVNLLGKVARAQARAPA